MALFWDVTPRNLVDVYQRFINTCFLRDQLRPEDGDSKHLWNVRKFLPEHTTLQTQKTAICISTAVKTTNPTE
jgi:hypothetical protein